MFRAVFLSPSLTAFSVPPFASTTFSGYRLRGGQQQFLPPPLGQDVQMSHHERDLLDLRGPYRTIQPPA